MMSKVSDILFSTRAAGVYFLVFAAAIGLATFIENDYGTAAAQKWIYQARWFEVLLLLFGITVLVNLFRFRLFRKEKWPVMLFHLSILIILLGAAITRYIGYEGTVHIREGQTSNSLLTYETWITTVITDGKNRDYHVQSVLFSGLGKNKYHQKYAFPQNGPTQKNIEVELLDFIPQAEKIAEEDPQGIPTLALVSTGSSGMREDRLLQPGDGLLAGSLALMFADTANQSVIHIKPRGDSLFIRAPYTIYTMRMADQHQDSLPANTYHPLPFRTLMSIGNANLVAKSYLPKGRIKIRSKAPKMTESEPNVALLKVSDGNQSKEVALWDYHNGPGKVEKVVLDGTQIELSYGQQYINLPFSIYLKDFQLERYPGSNSPKSYASEVRVLDPENGVEMDYRIYMNHILDYGGYRFFQASYDPDELGTVLSANHDRWGTLVSYLGYFLLALGMLASLFSKHSRFRKLRQKMQELRQKRKSAVATMALLILPLLASSQASFSPLPHDSISILPKEHVQQFERIQVQDFRGRMKPMGSLMDEVVRKVTRKSSMYGMSPGQIFLGMTVFPEQWERIPIIKVSHPGLRQILELGDRKYATYLDFFTEDFGYKLADRVEMANQRKPAQRSKLDNDVLKVDERLNIVNMVFTGQLLRLFPSLDSTDTHWLTPFMAAEGDQRSNFFIDNFMKAYIQTTREAMQTGNWSDVNELLTALDGYQKKLGKALLIPEKKLKAELLYNKVDIFNRLGKWYGLLGLLLLTIFFFDIFKPDSSRITGFRKMLTGVFVLFFLLHTAGLALRWYISGHAPWSNGYESMIYIAWATTLAGLLFAHRQTGALAATSILASLILMVAHLSWMDPQITPLMPVLRSYWLTIHVSMITASYGFLVLGGLMGFLNLILMITRTAKNAGHTDYAIKELTYLNEMSLTIGLILLSIGTFLGGIWANESWGRYWGWDPKETWALVTILVYGFILHMRFIPGMRGAYAFNLASVLGFFSVIMTYFGVNYYLSGLHSYAAGDPLPIPTFVYYTVGTIFAIAALAYLKTKTARQKESA